MGNADGRLARQTQRTKGRFYRCTQYSAYGKNACTLHHTPYKISYAFVLGRLQYWLTAVKENEDAFWERLLQGNEKQRRSENARVEKELKKALKRRQELNSLFAKMYEDRVKGLLDEENYSMLSVKYRTEQQQLDETVKINRMFLISSWKYSHRDDTPGTLLPGLLCQSITVHGFLYHSSVP